MCSRLVFHQLIGPLIAYAAASPVAGQNAKDFGASIRTEQIVHESYGKEWRKIVQFAGPRYFYENIGSRLMARTVGSLYSSPFLVVYYERIPCGACLCMCVPQ